jgi:hypothetical protein
VLVHGWPVRRGAMALDEWTAAGWELHTASTDLSNAGTKETFYHSLYFRHLKGQ